MNLRDLICRIFGHKTAPSLWGSQVYYCARCNCHWLELVNRGR